MRSFRSCLLRSATRRSSPLASRLLPVSTQRACVTTQLRSFTQKSFDCPDPGIHQTPIVDRLWRSRSSADERCSSAVQVVYPFSTDSAMRDRYANPWGKVRLGRILEDLDALAGNIAAAHCAKKDNGKPLLIVTASVDRIVISHRANLKDDMILSGQVAWVTKK